MSTSISTVNTELTEKCSMIMQYGARAIMIVLLFSLLSSIFGKLCYKDTYKSMCTKCHKRQCKHSTEFFTNLNSKLQSDFNYDLKNTVESEYRQEYLNQTQYDKAMLTPPNEENSFITGEAIRFNNNKNLRVDIFANLYLLNGNVYANSKSSFYAAYLSNKQNNVLLGKLDKAQDNVYKLSLDLPQHLSSYNVVQIVYHENDKTLLVLQGEF